MSEKSKGLWNKKAKAGTFPMIVFKSRCSSRPHRMMDKMLPTEYFLFPPVNFLAFRKMGNGQIRWVFNSHDVKSQWQATWWCAGAWNRTSGCYKRAQSLTCPTWAHLVGWKITVKPSISILWSRLETEAVDQVEPITQHHQSIHCESPIVLEPCDKPVHFVTDSWQQNIHIQHPPTYDKGLETPPGGGSIHLNQVTKSAWQLSPSGK